VHHAATYLPTAGDHRRPTVLCPAGRLRSTAVERLVELGERPPATKGLGRARQPEIAAPYSHPLKSTQRGAALGEFLMTTVIDDEHRAVLIL
jgi:hypothetical protein